MRYTFHWNPIKANENVRKHGIRFDRAAELFLDPLAISNFDGEHSEAEERWVTIGSDMDGRILVIVHTFSEVARDECQIRIISARKATRQECKQYKNMIL